MNIPKYWARSAPLPRGAGKAPFIVSCWHWSNESAQAAQRLADERAIELTRKFQAGMPLNHYGYSDRPLREEIVQSLPGPSGEMAAVITRNLYGALVLNTSRAMFIDVDFPQRHKPDAAEEVALKKVHEWSAARSGIGLRVYRTCAGLRCLVTNKTCDPTSPESIELLGSIGSDPLYVRLCKAQACFRARLTPKPWRLSAEEAPPQSAWAKLLRIGRSKNRPIEKAPPGFPWLDPGQEQRFRDWQLRYEMMIQKFSVCRFISHLGTTMVLPEIQQIIALHDQRCGVAANQTLA